MAGLWEELLAPASLGGVELPLSRRRVRGGRDFARKRLPYVSGQEVEDTGRQPRSLEVTAELFNDMDEDGLYPERYEELISVLQDDTDQSEVEWNDPVFGPIQVKVVSWDSEENAEERDGARVNISMEEVGFLDTVDLQFSLLTTSDRSRAETDGAEFDALIDELAITGGDIDAAWSDAGFAREPGETTSFADQVSDLSGALDAGAQRADQVQALVNVRQARVQAVLELSSARAANGWELIDLGSRLIDSVAAIGEEVLQRQARIIQFTTVAPVTSIFELAAQLYADRSRAEEIRQNNPVVAPLFIPAGTVLRVLEV